MIDPADKQTEALPLEPQKRGRGRPSTGQAMTPAEKQRAYRKRLADQQKSQVPAVQLEKVRSTAAEYLEKLGQQLADAKAETAAAIARADQAEKDLEILQKKIHKTLANNTEIRKDLELKETQLRHWIERTEAAERELELRYGKEEGRWIIQRCPKGKRKWTEAGIEGRIYDEKQWAEDAMNAMEAAGKGETKYRITKL